MLTHVPKSEPLGFAQAGGDPASGFVFFGEGLRKIGSFGDGRALIFREGGSLRLPFALWPLFPPNPTADCLIGRQS